MSRKFFNLTKPISKFLCLVFLAFILISISASIQAKRLNEFMANPDLQEKSKFDWKEKIPFKKNSNSNSNNQDFKPLSKNSNNQNQMLWNQSGMPNNGNSFENAMQNFPENTEGMKSASHFQNLQSSQPFQGFSPKTNLNSRLMPANTQNELWKNRLSAFEQNKVNQSFNRRRNSLSRLGNLPTFEKQKFHSSNALNKMSVNNVKAKLLSFSHNSMNKFSRLRSN